MRDTTNAIHEQVARLGERLGFEARREVSSSILSLCLDGAYHPHIDLMWSLPLDKPRRTALAWALQMDTLDTTGLPVVGIEVQATQPSTKTMASDAVNLAALGAPIGLLVVSEAGEKNIYRRAARAVRTIRRSFGDITVLPMDAAWLGDLLDQRWPDGLATLAAGPTKAAAGGESLDWSRDVRAKVRRMGRQAGFIVAEPYVPPILEATYDWASSRCTGRLRHTLDPCCSTVGTMTKAADYLTECQIDMAWLMPLPSALQAFLAAIDKLDPCHREHGLCFHELWNHCAVVAFEFESHGGKHAGGGLVNLGAYGLLGVAVTPSLATADDLSRTLRTYQPTLGLRNVFVRALP